MIYNQYPCIRKLRICNVQHMYNIDILTDLVHLDALNNHILSMKILNNLTRLTLLKCYFYDSSLNNLLYLSNLRILELVTKNYFLQDVNSSRLNNLHKLTLYILDNININTTILIKYTNLTYLNIHMIKYSENLSVNVIQLIKLKYLILANINIKNIQVGENKLLTVNTFEKLKNMD